MAADPVGGYWTTDQGGTVDLHNGASSFGSPALAGIHLNRPIVAMSATPDGQGYWLVASDGGVFSFGDATFYGSTGAIHLNQPIVGTAATPGGGGYWLVASDGGVFSFGDATFYGSTGAIHLNQPIVGMAYSPDGQGYWLVASDGGVFSFGDAFFYGSLAGTNSSAIGMVVTGTVAGYGLVRADGTEVLFPASSATTTAPPTADGPSCGGTAPLGMSGTWTCSFDDEFDGSGIDGSKWVAQLTASSDYTTGSGSGKACYVNSPDTVSVSNGLLHLSVVKRASSFVCKGLRGQFTTQYAAGMVTSDNLFSQTYGAFEVRASLPTSVVGGLQETLWLWPENDNEYGSVWPASGEVDFAEFYSQQPSFDIPYVHYNEAASDPNVTADCVIDPAGYNTYGVEWAPDAITIFVNGSACLTDHPDPARPLVAPEPFDQPFFLALTQALGLGKNALQPGRTSLPATTLVDWVRAWS
jgi:beta-glucanase (GH16 family)